MDANANKVRFGLSDVHIAKWLGNAQWAEPVHVPGAVSLTADPEGESEIFYADNGEFYTIVTNTGYKGSINLALIPDEIKKEIFGWGIDDNGALVEFADVQPVPFALLFKVLGDKRDRYNVFYHCLPTRPKTEEKTMEGKASPNTETMDLTITPEAISTRKVTKLSIEPAQNNTQAIEGFFNQVLVPSFTS